MKFSIKQIAAQSGVSKATVDRALHKRGNIHPHTDRRIAAAIRDLELQQRANLASGRTLIVDVVMHTPERFSSLVSAALLSQLGGLAPFRIMLRFHLFEQIETKALQQLLLRCASDSYGVILKVSDEAQLNACVAELLRQRVPVVTLATDLPDSARIRYVGMDNDSAGRTAAYLLSRWLGPQPHSIAVVLSSTGFRGEEDRVAGFTDELSQLVPQLRVVRISEGYGVDALTFERVSAVLAEDPTIDAVYSVGGGNQAILRAFTCQQRQLEAFIAHDLDEENYQLLATRQLDAVIDHDLRTDARIAMQAILRFHSFLPPAGEEGAFSRVNVVTPFNL